ncbi:hypothetical protein Trydic_g9990 [Trypoxylus dichotomus]
MERALQRRGVEPTLTRGDGGRAVCYRLCTGACWWMICYPIFGRRAFTRRVTPMTLPSWSAGGLRAWYPKGWKSHSGS